MASSNNSEPSGGLGLAATRAPAPFFLWGGQGKPKYVSTLPSAADTRNTPATSFVRHTSLALARLKPKYHQAEVSPSRSITKRTEATSFVPQDYKALARLKPKYHQENRALDGDRGIAGQGNKAHGCAAAEKHHSLPPGPLSKTHCCKTASLTDTQRQDASNATLLHVFIVTHCIL